MSITGKGLNMKTGLPKPSGKSGLINHPQVDLTQTHPNETQHMKERISERKDRALGGSAAFSTYRTGTPTHIGVFVNAAMLQIIAWNTPQRKGKL